MYSFMWYFLSSYLIFRVIFDFILVDLFFLLFYDCLVIIFLYNYFAFLAFSDLLCYLFCLLFYFFGDFLFDCFV